MTLPDRASVGYTTYRQHCAALGEQPDLGLSPMARAAVLPVWMTDELMATDAARVKLQSWAAQTPRPWAAWQPAAVLTALQFIGDEHLAHVTARLLSERLPPPVTDYLTTRVTWIGTGCALGGFCGPRVAFDDRPFLIVVSARGGDETALKQFENVVAHEAAHAWLLDEPSPGAVCASAEWMRTVHQLPLARVATLAPEALEAVRVQRQRYDRDERQAHALTRAWGFGDL